MLEWLWGQKKVLGKMSEPQGTAYVSVLEEIALRSQVTQYAYNQWGNSDSMFNYTDKVFPAIHSLCKERMGRRPLILDNLEPTAKAILKGKEIHFDMDEVAGARMKGIFSALVLLIDARVTGLATEISAAEQVVEGKLVEFEKLVTRKQLVIHPMALDLVRSAVAFAKDEKDRGFDVIFNEVSSRGR